MNLQRHWAAEAEMKSRGLKAFEMYFGKENHPLLGVVHFAVNYDLQLDYWTASYKLPPYKQQATMITVFSTPVVYKGGTVYTYATRFAAEAACKQIMKTLKASIK